MRNVKIVFEYDGAAYYGLQKQENVRTIQGEIERALNNLTGEHIESVVAGRTDKGVHAMNQVMNFFTNTKIPTEKIAQILNKRLPEDIKIKSSEEVDEEFNARFSAKSRRYVYIMRNQKYRNVFEEKYITFIKDDIVVENFVEMLNPLCGKHDFDSFRKSDCSAHSPVREIKSIEMTNENGYYKFYIEADGFLKSMVRIIVGSGLAVYFGEKDKDYILRNVENPAKNGEKIVAPPNGLYLYEVKY